MKIRHLTLILVALLTIPVYSQKIEELNATPISISYDKTLHFIFPAEVKYCRTGNDNILAEKVSTCPNIVRVISSLENFPGETNLSIVTADTKFYSYTIKYNSRPKQSYYKIDSLYIEPHVLPVGKEKMMYLIFPGKIIYEDHGSNNIIVEKAEGVDNILSIKAKNNYTEDTNISVVTENGKFYTFTLRFSLNPEIYTFVIDKEEQQKVAILDEGELNTIQKKKIYEQINKMMFLPLKLRDKIAGIKFEINNIFVYDNLLFFRITMENETQINYTIDFMRMYIQDAKITKKTAIQQLEQNILFTYDYPDEIPALEKRTFVVAVNKFTIPDKKRMIIELQEKNGGRHFYYKIKNKSILRAQQLFIKADPKEESKVDEILDIINR